MTIQYGACALHAGLLRLQTHTPMFATIVAFPLKQWFLELASTLRYTYNVCLVSLDLTLMPSRLLIAILGQTTPCRYRKFTVNVSDLK
jgi:hypothetical protein